MSKQLEHLDQIQEYRKLWPNLDILFLYTGIGSGDIGSGSVGAEIKDVQIDFVFDNDGELIIGEDEIKDHFALSDAETEINFLESIVQGDTKELIIVTLGEL